MNEISLKRTKKNARLSLLMQYFLMGFVFSSLLSRFPALQELYGLSMKQLSFVPFFMSVGSLIIMPFCGYLVGKYGCKRLSVTGYIYIGLFPLLTLMPNLYALYLLCGIYGIFVSLTDISINANSILVEKAYKKPIIGMFHAFFYVGMCSGALLSIFFLFLNILVVYHLFLVAGVAMVVFYFIRTFFLKETPSKINLSGRMKILFPKGILLLIAFIAFCGRIIEGSVSDWSTVYMKTIIDLSEEIAPVGLAIYAAFIAFGRFFGDSIRKRYKESAILLGCCILTVTGLSIMIAKAEITFAIAGLFISGIGLSCLVPVIYSMAGNQKNITPGMGIAMVNTISGTGFLFGPFIIGLIADLYSMRVSFGYVLLLTFIMTLLTVILRVREK
jgi:MFS family permease